MPMKAIRKLEAEDKAGSMGPPCWRGRDPVFELTQVLYLTYRHRLRDYGRAWGWYLVGG